MPTPLALGYYITCLTRTSWLSSIVIEEYVSLVAQQVPDTYFHYTTDSNLDKLIQEPRRHNYNKYRDFKQHNKICICLNKSGVHFISAKIDKITNSIAIAETLDVQNEEITRKLITLAEKVGCEGTMRVIKLKMPNQKNSFDCGALSCLSLLYMAQNIITPDSELQYDTESCARMMRLRIFSDLMRGHVTLLRQVNQQPHKKKRSAKKNP
jgi:Ulp1 family protease